MEVNPNAGNKRKQSTRNFFYNRADLVKAHSSVFDPRPLVAQKDKVRYFRLPSLFYTTIFCILIAIYRHLRSPSSLLLTVSSRERYVFRLTIPMRELS